MRPPPSENRYIAACVIMECILVQSVVVLRNVAWIYSLNIISGSLGVQPPEAVKFLQFNGLLKHYTYKFLRFYKM